MTNNQATLHKLDQMRLHGMARALRTSLDTQGQWTADELLAHLVDAESDDRHERRLKRLLKAARFRYPAAIEEVDFALRRNLDQNQLLRRPTAAGSVSTRTSSSPANAAPGRASWPPRWATRRVCAGSGSATMRPRGCSANCAWPRPTAATCGNWTRSASRHC